MKTTKFYNLFEFVSHAEIFTIAMIASFASWKLLNVLYEDVYDPTIDILIDDNHCEKYIIEINNYEFKIGLLMKEFFKWLIVIILLMICHNIFVHLA